VAEHPAKLPAEHPAKLPADELGTGKVPRLLVTYSLTTLAALLFNSLYTLADALFVSWGVGPHALGGVSVAFPFVIVQSAISTALGGGAASIISRRLGEGRHADAGQAALNAMVTFWVSAICISILGLVFLDPMLRALGTSEELYPYTKEYLTVILIGNIFSTGFSSIIRAEGRMKYALLIWVIPISINIVLDAVFVLLLHWGVRGSAVATVICQFTSFSMSLLFFSRYSCLIFKGAKLSRITVGEILATGFPSLIQQGGMAAGLVIMNNVLKTTGGSAAITAYAYISKIINFAVMPFMAIIQALSPIAGYNYGTNAMGRVREARNSALVLAIAYALIMLAIAELFPRQLLRLLTNDAGVLDLGTAALRITALALPFFPTAMIAGALWQAAGKKAASLVMYSLQVLFLIPAVYAGAAMLGVTGVWWASPVSALCSTVAAGAALLLWGQSHRKSPAV
jgi:putative MATE family efflux protein